MVEAIALRATSTRNNGIAKRLDLAGGERLKNSKSPQNPKH